MRKNKAGATTGCSRTKWGSVAPNVGQTFSEVLLLLDQSGGVCAVLIVSLHSSGLGSLEIVGVLHQFLEGVLIELDHILGGAGRRHDAAGGTQPLVIVAKLPLFLS